MRLLHIDFEVYSEVDIKSAPLNVYAAHPSTRIILAAYAIDDGPVHVWEADGEKHPQLRVLLADPHTTVVAWNTTYERTVLAEKGMRIPLERWLDPMVMARYAGLPGRLKDCVKVPMIGVPEGEKTKNETLLIKKFCTPDPKGRSTADLKREYAEDWKLFVDYCRKDVLSMRQVYHYLEERFPFPERERQLWMLDQRINDRGFPVDVALAKAGRQAAASLTSNARGSLQELTGLENSNSVQQLLPWLQERGYRYDSLGKGFIEFALAGDSLTAEARKVLETRLSAAKSSVKKFDKFIEVTGPDGRARGQFVYYGAHTGRWSGRGVQPHNLPRKGTDKNALATLLSAKPVDSLATLSTCLRPCIHAPTGRRLVVADLSAIENRVLAWLSGCEDMLSIYANGRDPYKSFGVELFKKDYDDITKDERQLCKPAVLGCGYGLGGGQEREMQNGQKVKTGLWAYAENMGVDLSKEESHRMVQVFRSAYPEVMFYWTYLEDAFLAAYKTRKRQQVGAVYFTATKEAVKIELPAGRCIHYLNPHAWRGADGLHISFDGLRQGGWGRQSTWGGRLTENVVQAIARDVLAQGMSRAEGVGMTVVGHVHDELICEEDINQPGAVLQLEACLSAPMDWAPGLPLAAEGYESEFYMKG